MTDWTKYQKCDVCSSEIGEACLSLSGLLANGGPVAVTVDVPHGSRKLRAGAAREVAGRG